MSSITQNAAELKLCGFTSAVPEDLSTNTAKMLVKDFNVKYFEDWRQMLDS
ncbi:MAG: hypothetical protein GY750_09125 [Lentisphaerae bacterium]|nr:hypothetical protein [Lentisphaerota bacterium]MCP4101573.1 hypothetical protein [Lentisphaerota bacterium]